jgi:hypothetical protein
MLEDEGILGERRPNNCIQNETEFEKIRGKKKISSIQLQIYKFLSEIKSYNSHLFEKKNIILGKKKE